MKTFDLNDLGDIGAKRANKIAALEAAGYTILSLGDLATMDELVALPGIGETTAQKIIESAQELAAQMDSESQADSSPAESDTDLPQGDSAEAGTESLMLQSEAMTESVAVSAESQPIGGRAQIIKDANPSL